MKYELFYLIGGTREADAEKIRKEVSGIIASAGGVFEEKETLEKRRLSYKIKHETHGIYIAQRFELEDNQKIGDIVGKMNLNSEVLRFILSRASELPPLKSKEERIADQEKRSAPAEKTKEEKKPIVPEIRKPSEQKPADANKEDIDKKLEEILNI